jgi:uncharacterized membrane protein
MVLLLSEQAGEEHKKVQTVGALGVLVLLALPTGIAVAAGGYGLHWIYVQLMGKVKGQGSNPP